MTPDPFLEKAEEIHQLIWPLQSSANYRPGKWAIDLIAQALQEVDQKAREECAKTLEKPNSEILMACGEMSAQELRTVKAVLKWLAETIRKGLIKP